MQAHNGTVTGIGTNLTSGDGPKPPAIQPLRYTTPGDDADIAPEPRPERDLIAADLVAARDEEWRARCEAAREEGLRAGREMVERDRLALFEQCAAQWQRALAEFLVHRDRYFAKVEREVVELALAIAARILQREAQLDPLLLSGAVRVALGQLSDSTAVQLRVPAGSHAVWSEMLRLMPGLALRPELVADSEMKDGECLLETGLGRIDLGVRAQLKEIERGFFDLLAHRDSIPAAQARS